MRRVAINLSPLRPLMTVLLAAARAELFALGEMKQAAAAFPGANGKAIIEGFRGTRRALNAAMVALLLALALMLALPSVARAAPANDNFASAQTISGESASVNGTNVGATTETGEPNTIPSSSSSVWYSWTAPHSGYVAMDTCTSSFDTVLSVYKGSALTSLTQVAQNDDDSSCSPTNLFGSKVTFAAEGTTYHIRVASFAGQQGSFTLNLGYVAPPNDNFASAETISGESASVNGTNVQATAETGEPSPFSSTASVWYSWTAPYTGQVEIDTCTSDFDTILNVYKGDALTSLTQVAQNDDDNSCSTTNPLGSKVIFATEGTTYHIRVAGFASQQGGFTLNLVLTDNVAPETTITGGPNGQTDDDTPTFSFDGSDNKTAPANLRFFYRVDGGNWVEASGTSVTLESLPDGPHTFSVKAVDEAGNEDQSPAEQPFTVEKRTPMVETVSPTGPGVSRMTNVTATFSEPMDPTTLTTKTIKMKIGKKTVPVTVSLSADGKTVTLDPYPSDPLKALAPDKKYKVTITTAVKDLQGKALDQDPALSGNQPKIWDFTTGST